MLFYLIIKGKGGRGVGDVALDEGRVPQAWRIKGAVAE